MLVKAGRQSRGSYLELSCILVICPIIIHQADELQAIPRRTLEIIRVMSRCDLDRTSTKFHIDRDGIGDNGYPASKEGVNGGFAVKVFVAGIVGMDGDGGISKHGLRSGGGDDNLFVWDI